MNKKIQIAMNVTVALIFIYLCTRIDFREIYAELRLIPVTMLVLILSLQIIEMILITYQDWRLARHLDHHIPFLQMNYVTSGGHVFDAITPGGGVGGEAVKIMMLKNQMGVPISTGTAIVLSQKTISGCMLLFLCFCGFFYLTSTTLAYLPISFKIAIYVVLALILFLLIYIFYNPRKFIKKCEKIKREKIKNPIINFLEGIEQVGRDKKECAKLMFISLCVWLEYPFKLYLLLRVTDINMSFLSIFAIIIISCVVAMIPIFPGGMLGFEGSMTSLLALYGVAADKALFITTLYRIITFWFVIFASAIYMGIYKVCSFFYKPSRNLK
ncbi:MAG: flippase-like domain-containing protein [Clostridia bacterium]|nr:flippase-like domain-containing protein [Clostridia bacterium]